jgi:hypothetical protein
MLKAVSQVVVQPFFLAWDVETLHATSLPQQRNPNMDKFQNKYRVPSARLQQWDYRWTGMYFITICTQHRIHYFGTIQNHQMQLSQVGVIADLLWHQIPHHAQNIELGPYVVMPNHMHGI